LAGILREKDLIEDLSVDRRMLNGFEEIGYGLDSSGSG
jgi:hypothetical protein